MGFSYFYHSISLHKENAPARRPIIPLIINGLAFTGLLDSGSDSIVIPSDIAEVLSLEKLGETTLFQMDGTPLNCDISEIEIEFGTLRENKKFKAPVLISNSPRIILGRQGFFEHFKITFDERNNKIIFKINHENPIYRK